MYKLMVVSFFRTLLNIPVWLLSLPLVPLGLLFCSKDDTNLPKALSWFDEPTYGINGDIYWQGPEHANGHQREFLWRWRWLVRNSLGGWSHRVMGFHYSEMESIWWLGDPKTSNRPEGHSGVQHIVITLKNGKKKECGYIVKQWGNSSTCFRFYFGYKLKDVLDFYLREGRLPTDKNVYAQDVFSPNPVMRYAK